MQLRLPYYQLAPEGYQGMMKLEEYLHHSSLPQPLLHLIKLRASQINGCAFCIDMHWKDLRAIGEPEHRLYGLDAWRDAGRTLEPLLHEPAPEVPPHITPKAV